MLSNYSSCNCSLDNVLKTSTNNRGVLIKDGYGVSECNIKGDTNLRQGNVERHYKSDLQLFPRPYLTTPSNILGDFKPNLESKLINSQQYRRHKQMQTYGYDNIATPLVPWIEKNIQDPENIIQEHVNCNWVRGGIDSRGESKFNDYINRSTDSDIIKQMLIKKMGCLYN